MLLEDFVQNYIKQLKTKFTIPDAFDAAAFFHDSYGMLTDDHMAVERIVMRAYGFEQYYLCGLPLHHSQRDINTTEEYTDFELHLKPTSDFKAQLLSRGECLGMTKLFQLAEYVCNRCSLEKEAPTTPEPQKVIPTIRFSKEDRFVEGELFK